MQVIQYKVLRHGRDVVQTHDNSNTLSVSNASGVTTCADRERTRLRRYVQQIVYVIAGTLYENNAQNRSS